MTPDEAKNMANNVAHSWPRDRWTPANLAVWTTNLEGLEQTDATRALVKLKNRLEHAPSWAEFRAEAMVFARLRETPVELAPSEVWLDRESHMVAIARLREEHPFIQRKN